MGVLGEKCSPKWANFTLKQGENKKKHASYRKGHTVIDHSERHNF